MTALLCESSQTHLGTQMPSGGGHIIRAFLHEVEVDLRSIGRTRDRQDWSATAQRARRAGHDAVVYLNRFEGMQTDRLLQLIETGLSSKLDTMSDKDFRKAVPEAEDSILVVNPEAMRVIRIFDREGSVVWSWDQADAMPIEIDLPEL